MAEKTSTTIRELIKTLSDATDLDAEVRVSVFNSDPISINSADYDDDGNLLLSYETAAGRSYRPAATNDAEEALGLSSKS